MHNLIPDYIIYQSDMYKYNRRKLYINNEPRTVKKILDSRFYSLVQFEGLSRIQTTFIYAQRGKLM